MRQELVNQKHRCCLSQQFKSFFAWVRIQWSFSYETLPVLTNFNFSHYFYTPWVSKMSHLAFLSCVVRSEMLLKHFLYKLVFICHILSGHRKIGINPIIHLDSCYTCSPRRNRWKIVIWSTNVLYLRIILIETFCEGTFGGFLQCYLQLIRCTISPHWFGSQAVIIKSMIWAWEIKMRRADVTASMTCSK